MYSGAVWDKDTITWNTVPFDAWDEGVAVGGIYVPQSTPEGTEFTVNLGDITPYVSGGYTTIALVSGSFVGGEIATTWASSRYDGGSSPPKLFQWT